MRAVLLDTNVASVLFDKQHANHQESRSFLHALGESRVYVPSIVWGEIRYGYKVHDKVDAFRRDVIEKEMTKFAVLDIDKNTAEYYSQIRSRLFRMFGTTKNGKIKQKVPENLVEKSTGKSLGIQENDLWMVALAAQYNMAFVTLEKMTRLREATKIEYPLFQFLNWLNNE